jgi:hypothetical protein
MHKSMAAMSQQGRSSYMSFLALDVDHEPDVEMLFAPGTLCHIKEVLKLCIVQVAQACNLDAPMLAEELAAISKAIARP